jgi:hypothetical protein
MLPRERQDWYCWHCHSGGEVLLCSICQRVFHEICVKSEYGIENAKIGVDVATGAAVEWTCPFCKVGERDISLSNVYRALNRGCRNVGWGGVRFLDGKKEKLADNSVKR